MCSPTPTIGEPNEQSPIRRRRCQRREPARRAPGDTARRLAGAAEETSAAPASAPSATQMLRSHCDESFSARRWRAAIDSCTLAFALEPRSEVALRVAHSHYAEGDAALAGTWAAKALELGVDDADAFVLVGHSELRAGHPRAALTAYRHYLRRAPHGWPARKLRAAVRGLSRRAASLGRAARAGATLDGVS